MQTQFVANAAALAERVDDGSCMALAPDYSGCAMQVALQIALQGTRQLQLVGVPQIGLQGDWLIGAGCVASIDAAAVTLGELGPAPRFVEAVTAGRLQMRDSTCPIIHAGLQAAEKNIPFMPIRGVLGSDLVRHRDDWRTINNPFADRDDSVLLVPQIKPDIALLHAPLADRDGNVWIGIRRELMLMAHAAKRTLVSVERFTDDNLLADPVRAAGVIPGLYVSAIAVAEKGANPTGLFGEYAADTDTVAGYRSAATSDAACVEWLQEYASTCKQH